MWRGTVGPLSALLALTWLAAACDGGPTAPAVTPVATTASPAASPATSTPASGASTSSATPSPTPSALPSPTPAATSVPAPAPTATTPPAASTPTPDTTPSATPGPAGTPSGTPTPTGTPAGTPGATPTATPTGTPAPVAHVTASPGLPLRLARGVVADLPDGRTLALIDVTADSRCPADVQCVWAGEANLLFEWTTAGETRRVPLVVSPSRGRADLPDGSVLRALELRPATSSGRTIPVSEYVVTVVIEPAGPPGGGAFGSVTVGPSCPVQREGVPCPDRPLAATLVFRDVAGVEVARALSDAAGFYAVALSAGHYTIVPFTPGGASLPRGVPRDVDVPAGAWIVADVTYDSGIR